MTTDCPLHFSQLSVTLFPLGSLTVTPSSFLHSSLVCHPLFCSGQVICEKIFRPWFSPTLLGAKAGLPLQVDLQRAVQECVDTAGGEDEEQDRAVQKRLLDLLTGLLHQGTSSEHWGKGGEDREGIHPHTALNFWSIALFTLTKTIQWRNQQYWLHETLI